MKKENKKDDRSTNWATVVYPDGAPDNWLQILRDMLIPCFVSPLHDQDYNADGEPKKPHYHVQFCFDSNSKRSRDQIKELTDHIVHNFSLLLSRNTCLPKNPLSGYMFK